MANPLVRRIYVDLITRPAPPPPAPLWKRLLWVLSPWSYVCEHHRSGEGRAVFAAFGNTRARATRDACEYLGAVFPDGEVTLRLRRPTGAERLRLAGIYD